MDQTERVAFFKYMSSTKKISEQVIKFKEFKNW